jgi:nucleotide-binding universal stress UspA family protein
MDERNGAADGEPSKGVRLVVLGTDLGDASAPAEGAAIGLASRMQAQLLVVNVIDPGVLRLPGGHFLMRLDQLRRQREAAVSEIVERARASGVTARFLVWEGEPGPGLLEAVAAEGGDLIVVGSHHRGRLGRLLLGSVSTHVVEHADRPVVVARGDGTIRYEPAAGRTPVG